MKKFKIALIISLLFNVLIISVLGALVYKKGGISYLVDVIEVTFASNEENSYNHHYLSRRSLFETLDNTNVNDILFVGDSITEGNEWTEVFQDLSIKNRGVGWDTTAGLLDRLDTLIKSKPQKIFLMIGTNDIDAGIDTEQTIANYKTILTKIQSESPNTTVFVQSVLPVNENILNSKTRTNSHITELNQRIKKLALEMNIVYIDLVPKVIDKDSQLRNEITFDGLHLKGEGYSIWIDSIKQYVIN